MGKGDGGRISRLKKASSKSFSYLMVLPAVLLFTLFAVYPFVEGIKLGFYRWDGLSPMTFIGMENYVNILHDEQYWSALKNTFLYAVVTTIAKNLLGLVLAMVMMKITHGKGFFRTITYMPVTFSYVVCGILWLWIFNPNFGLLNNFLRLIGADGLVMGWLSDSRIAIYSVMAVDIWRWAGFHMVLYLAGLQAIPKDYYEAADIDGAGRFQTMIYVTLPCIAPTIIIMFIMATGNVIQDDFDQIYNMLNAKVMDVGDVIGTYTYRMGIEKMNFSYATAVGLFKNVVSLILVTFTNAFSRKLSGSSLW